MSFAFEEDGHAPLQCLWQRAGAEWQHVREEAAKMAADGHGQPLSHGHGQPPPPTLVVAHGAFNRALLGQALGLPMVGWRDDKEHFLFGNCECIELEWRCPVAPSKVEVGASPALDEAHLASRWRRRYPHESPWLTRAEEVERYAALRPTAEERARDWAAA